MTRGKDLASISKRGKKMRYIDVEPLEDKLKEHIRKTESELMLGALSTFLRLLDIKPTADVVPVRHGHWQITDAYPHNVYCSECYTKYAQTHWAVWEDGSMPRRYCPNCGARMDGEDDEIDRR